MDAFVISSLPSRLKETLQTEGPTGIRARRIAGFRRAGGALRFAIALGGSERQLRFVGHRRERLPLHAEFGALLSIVLFAH
jgi:hypothetical protein